jgi:hypothetical protein
MAMSYYNISLHHLADHLIHLSSSSSFWFSLNSIYDNEFHLSRQLGTSCPAGCCIASFHPLVVPLYCPVPLIAVTFTLAPSIACRRCAVCRCCAAAAVAAAATAATLLPSCCQRCAVALPPLPLTLPPLPREYETGCYQTSCKGSVCCGSGDPAYTYTGSRAKSTSTNQNGERTCVEPGDLLGLKAARKNARSSVGESVYLFSRF